MKLLVPARLALGFLSQIPVGKLDKPSAVNQGRALLWYPVVGLFLGCLVFLPQYLPAPFYLVAGISIALWVALTGGLHLDGLADCADAWMGGLGNKQTTLDLLKDPLCGSMAVLSLVLVIVLKVLALAGALEQGNGLYVIFVPVLGRLVLLVLFLTTPYVREQGLGEILAHHFPRYYAAFIFFGLTALLAVILPGALWMAWVLALAPLWWLLRRAFLRRLDGFTGDCAGALVELSETLALLVLACVSLG